MPDQTGLRSSRRRFTVFEAVAKATPSEPPDRLMMVLTMPTTSPPIVKTGLPELPELTAASVCRNSTPPELSVFLSS